MRNSNLNKVSLRLLLCVALLTGVLIITPSTPARALETPTYEVDELEAGMEGYGLTVFDGQNVEAFPVEVLGVLKNVMPDQDMILIKASGPRVEKTQIMSGMSGSPIYINDHLIGALAYSWPFEKEPIAGVTPVKNLLGAHREKQASVSSGNIKEISTPLVASGFSAEAISSLEKQLDRFDISAEVITGGNQSTAELPTDSSQPLEPGSAVGAQLVRGDLNLAAVGTVTAVDSESGRVYAFGHPFLNGGRLAFPMTGARVQTYLPSLRSSFKLASPLEPLGSIVEDRQAGIVGELGEKTEMIPVEVKLKRADEDFSEQYDVEIVRNKQLTPGLFNLVATSFAGRKLSQLGVNLLKTEVELEISGEPDLQLTKLYSGSGAFDPWSFTPISRLWQNRFQRPEIKRGRVEITLFDKRREAEISGLWTEPAVATPGEELTVFASVNPYRDAKFTEKFKFNLPENLQGNKLKIVVMPATRLLQAEPQPRSLEGLIKYFNSVKLQNQLAVVVQSAGLNLQVAGEQVNDVPLSTASPLLTQGKGKLKVKPRMVKKLRELNWVLSGNQELTLPLGTR